MEKLNIKIVNVKKVKLEQGDTMFFSVNTNSPITLNSISEKLCKYFPDQKVIVMNKQVKLQKICHTKKEE
jgi:hypothetical protein